LTEYWWLSELEGRARGPFTADQIAAMIAERRLARDEMIWSAARKRWIAARKTGAPETAPRSRFARGLMAAGVGATYVAAGAACIILLYVKGADTWDTDLTIALWPIVGVVLLLASAGVWTVWGRPGDFGVRRPELAAVRSIAVSLLALLGAIVGALQLYQAKAVVSALRGIQGYSYSITSDDARQAIKIRGYIGAGFATTLRRVQQAHPDVKTIEVTSLGGLTDEALDAAKLIEAQRMTVVVRKVCASACLLLLAGGQERLADYGATLDFHATAPVSSEKLPAIVWNAGQQDALVRAYFEARGFPKDVVDAAYRLGPSKVESLSTLEALDLHILTGVLDNETPVQPAKLRDLLAGAPRRSVRPAVFDDPD
jgi:hypothetical protein